MSLTSMSIVLTVLVLNLHHHGHHAPPVVPKKVYFIMTRHIAHTIGMANTVERYENNRFHVTGDNVKANDASVASTSSQSKVDFLNYNKFTTTTTTAIPTATTPTTTTTITEKTNGINCNHNHKIQHDQRNRVRFNNKKENHQSNSFCSFCSCILKTTSNLN
jgi:hypothetical protein